MVHSFPLTPRHRAPTSARNDRSSQPSRINNEGFGLDLPKSMCGAAVVERLLGVKSRPQLAQIETVNTFTHSCFNPARKALIAGQYEEVSESTGIVSISSSDPSRNGKSKKATIPEVSSRLPPSVVQFDPEKLTVETDENSQGRKSPVHFFTRTPTQAKAKTRSLFSDSDVTTSDIEEGIDVKAGDREDVLVKLQRLVLKQKVSLNELSEENLKRRREVIGYKEALLSLKETNEGDRETIGQLKHERDVLKDDLRRLQWEIETIKKALRTTPSAATAAAAAVATADDGVEVNLEESKVSNEQPLLSEKKNTPMKLAVSANQGMPEKVSLQSQLRLKEQQYRLFLRKQASPKEPPPQQSLIRDVEVHEMKAPDDVTNSTERRIAYMLNRPERNAKPKELPPKSPRLKEHSKKVESGDDDTNSTEQRLAYVLSETEATSNSTEPNQQSPQEQPKGSFCDSADETNSPVQRIDFMQAEVQRTFSSPKKNRSTSKSPTDQRRRFIVAENENRNATTPSGTSPEIYAFRTFKKAFVDDPRYSSVFSHARRDQPIVFGANSRRNDSNEWSGKSEENSIVQESSHHACSSSTVERSNKSTSKLGQNTGAKEEIILFKNRLEAIQKKRMHRREDKSTTPMSKTSGLPVVRFGGTTF